MTSRWLALKDYGVNKYSELIGVDKLVITWMRRKRLKKMADTMFEPALHNHQLIVPPYNMEVGVLYFIAGCCSGILCVSFQHHCCTCSIQGIFISTPQTFLSLDLLLAPFPHTVSGGSSHRIRTYLRACVTFNRTQHFACYNTSFLRTETRIIDLSMGGKGFNWIPKKVGREMDLINIVSRKKNFQEVFLCLHNFVKKEEVNTTSNTYSI